MSSKSKKEENKEEVMRYILRVIDFETTGAPEDGEHSVIESAYVDIDMSTRKIISNNTMLVKPSTPMDIKAQAVHHISHAEASRYGRSWDQAQGLLLAPSMLHNNDEEQPVFVAHNAEFEKKFFDPADSKWIDTYKVALKMHPEAPGHSNQCLKYYLGIKDQAKHHPPHRALPDCFVTAEILIKMAENCSFNDMIKTSREPKYFTRFVFGKYKGKKFAETPKDYLEWVLRQQDMDEDIKFNIRRVLGAQNA